MRRRRRRGESGVVSNSCCNNNLGIPTTTIAVGRVRAGVGTKVAVGATGVNGSGSHEFNLQWFTS
jgi:hypothetical protein